MKPPANPVTPRAQTGMSAPAATRHFLGRTILRYGLALGSVAVATALGFLADPGNLHRRWSFVMLLSAVSLTAWYAGVWPAIIAAVVGELAFDFFFTPPIYALSFGPEDLKDICVFALFSALLIWFGVVRRRAEGKVRQARDELESKVVERTADLRASERKYRQLIDTSPDAVFVLDKTGKCVLGNVAAAHLYGCTENELIGLPMTATCLPDERHLLQERIERVGNQPVLRFERQFLRKDNQTLLVEVSLSAASEDQYQELVRDITERKRAEQQLKKQAELLSLAHDAIIVRGPENRITFWNAGAEKTYGWTAADAIGKITHELLHTRFPVSQEAVDAALQEERQWEGELTHTTRDGRTIVVASRQSLRREGPAGSAVVMEINRDITDRKRAEAEIRKLNEELEQRVIGRTRELQAVNKELEAFAYSVSHDLRAPVRHIAGFTELLKRHSGSASDDKSRHHISMILDAANRMGRLIDDLLAFSRIGRAQTQKTTVDLSRIVKGVIGEFAPDTRGRKIVWRVGELPKCYGDPAMLRLVFTNLVSNALKFTRTREQAEIEINSLNHSPAEVVVFVKDNGVGFDMRYKDKLFGVFQRLHSQEAFEGTGIGLATVQRIIHAHGGKVWPESSVDHGATFYVALPEHGKANA